MQLPHRALAKFSSAYFPDMGSQMWLSQIMAHSFPRRTLLILHKHGVLHTQQPPRTIPNLMAKRKMPSRPSKGCSQNVGNQASQNIGHFWIGETRQRKGWEPAQHKGSWVVTVEHSFQLLSLY